MKRKTKKILACLFGIPLLIIVLAIFVLYVKVHFDFPANKTGYNDFVKVTNVKIKNESVFVRYTGWEDTQTYFRFSASPDEIDRIVESIQLKPANSFTQTSGFYWWKPKMCKECKYFESKEGSEWKWLYYNPESKDVYYFATTF